MNESTWIFTYTARRGAYLGTVSAFASLILLESGVLALLIGALVPNGLLRLALLGALAGLVLYLIFGVLLAPFWTRHRLTATHLELRYGRDTISLPRAAIVAAQPAHERLHILQPLRAQHEPHKQRIVAAFSEHGQVLLTLDRPYTLRVNRTEKPVDRILINLDHRDAFLAALGRAATPTTLPASSGSDAHSQETRSSANCTRPDRAPTLMPFTSSTGMSTEGPSGPERYSGPDAVLPFHPGTRSGRLQPRRKAPPPSPPTRAVRERVPARFGKRSSGPRAGARTAGKRRSAETSAAIRIEHLSRRYGDVLAVDDLNLAIQPGEIYGFLGPNGAGKTTTLKMLVGLLEPDAGHAVITGHDVWGEPLAAKAALGYVPDRAILYERLTGREFLAFLAQLRGLPQQEANARISELLELLELSDRADSLCGTYSFGMKRKLALAGALLHWPPVLILDEPLNGLDPRSARRLKDLFAGLATNGAAIMLSTHDLATAEAVCHRVGIIHRGRLVAEGTAHELRRLAAAPDLEAVFLSLTEEPILQGSAGG
jgi:ABC-type multidrug transport system ATPase subunit